MGSMVDGERFQNILDDHKSACRCRELPHWERHVTAQTPTGSGDWAWRWYEEVPLARPHPLPLHTNTSELISNMGALLSLPLLAIPSVGTVSEHPRDSAHVPTTRHPY
jgi:hypothetical protein